jgi:putative restriction endonuclease
VELVSEDPFRAVKTYIIPNRIVYSIWKLTIMKFYWVNQKQTFQEESEGGFLWAPQKNKKGNSNWHWSNLEKVRPGDVVFCYVRKEIKAIGVITSSAITSPEPFKISQWSKVGWLAKMRYNILEQPIAIADIIGKVGYLFPSKHSPYSISKQRGNQVYLAEIPKELGKALLTILKAQDLIESVEQTDKPKTETQTRQESDQVTQIDTTDFALTPSEKEMVIKQRLVQREFKTELLKRHNERCALTGLSKVDLLIASHIKPWSKSSEFERRDVNNGLLLCSPVDALFDKHYISFYNDGTIIISESLGNKAQKVYGIMKGMKLIDKPNSETQKYLAYHRQNLK